MTKETYAKELLSDNSLEQGVQFAIVNNSTLALMGDIYLKQENDAFWIGYAINPLYARQGYVYEVISEVISWTKQHGCVCVKASVLPDNIASINLLNKLKFSYAGMDDCGEQIYILHL